MSDALLAETIRITGHNGDEIEAYSARALDDSPRGGVVVIHHMPGYDPQTKEIARNFAYHGYQQAFGVLSLLIVVMTYLYIAAVAFLVGAELDALLVTEAQKKRRR